MPSTVWITIGISIISLIVATIVTLSVAALHRKQMRQIELHRADPSVPLVPPPHPITRYFKSHGVFIISNGLFIINISMNLFFLIGQLRRTGPVTRPQVFIIALCTAVIMFLVLMQILVWLIQRAMDLAHRTLELIGKVTDAVTSGLKKGEGS